THLGRDLCVLGLDEGIGEDPRHKTVADMLPVFLSLEYLPQDRRPGIGMLPEVIIANHPGNLGCHRVLRYKIPGNDPGRTDISIDMEEGDLFFDPCDLLLTPAVVVPPLDHPAIRPCLRRHGSCVPVEPEVRYREHVAFARTGRNQGEKAGKFPYRAPDCKHAIFPELYPVD